MNEVNEKKDLAPDPRPETVEGAPEAPKNEKPAELPKDAPVTNRDVETKPLSQEARAEEFPRGDVAPPQDVPQPVEAHDVDEAEADEPHGSADEADDEAEDDSEDIVEAQPMTGNAPPEAGQGGAHPGAGPSQAAQPGQQQGQPGEGGRRRRRRRRGRGGRGRDQQQQGQPGQQGPMSGNANPNAGQGGAHPGAAADQPQAEGSRDHRAEGSKDHKAEGSRDHKAEQQQRQQQNQQSRRERQQQHEQRQKERQQQREKQQGEKHGERDKQHGEKQHGDRHERGERHGRDGERGHGRHGRDRHERDEQRRERERGEHVHHRAEKSKKPIKREVLANTSFEETRIAIVEDGRLAELLWERKSEESIVGNIYKGQVENVLPGISSAFVNIGFEKNAYLYISDVLGERGASIDATLKKGQQIMIQVAKDAISTKGMKVTMDVSLPGRFLVFTPFQNYVGISKHIEDANERKRLGAVVDRLVAEVLGGKGVVVRTEAEGASEADLEREVKYLKATWDQIEKKFNSQPAPALLHKDLDLTLQVARDILSDQVYVYLVDNKAAHQRIVDFVKGISPELEERVRLYDAKTPIFKAFNLEKDIEEIRKTKVPLPNGGSIVIQEAESLCAIDVNTGRYTGSKSQEETVTQTNIEAATEVAHQLRLRNIGGIIVVDFIDMRKASNRNKVMEAFAQACKNDRAKIRILPITRLGLIELTRERKRESTVSLITDECPECKGAGRVLSAETIRIRIQREIGEMTGGRPGGQVRLLLHPKLAEAFRQMQQLLEKNVQRSVKVQGDPQIAWEDYRIVLE